MNDVSAMVNIRWYVVVKNKGDKKQTVVCVAILCKMFREDLSDIMTCMQEPQGNKSLNHHVSGVRNSREIRVEGMLQNTSREWNGEMAEGDPDHTGPWKLFQGLNLILTYFLRIEWHDLFLYVERITRCVEMQVTRYKIARVEARRPIRLLA